VFCGRRHRTPSQGHITIQRAEHRIFRIGSCNSQAQPDPSAENKDTISYFLLGIQVPEAHRPHSIKRTVYHDGSSIATALAAGLMSMILHCIRSARILPHDCPDISRTFTQWAERLREHEHRRTALNNIVIFPAAGLSYATTKVISMGFL
jgi:hypothetical protein